MQTVLHGEGGFMSLVQLVLWVDISSAVPGGTVCPWAGGAGGGSGLGCESSALS